MMAPWRSGSLWIAVLLASATIAIGPRQAIAEAVVVGLRMVLPASVTVGASGNPVGTRDALRVFIEAELINLGVKTVSVAEETQRELATVEILVRVTFVSQSKEVWTLRSDVEDRRSVRREPLTVIPGQLAAAPTGDVAGEHAKKVREAVRRMAGIRPSVVVSCFWIPPPDDPDLAKLRVLLPAHLPASLTTRLKDRGLANVDVTGFDQNDVAAICIKGDKDLLKQRTLGIDFRVEGTLTYLVRNQKIEVMSTIYVGDKPIPVKEQFIRLKTDFLLDFVPKAEELGAHIAQGWPK